MTENRLGIDVPAIDDVAPANAEPSRWPTIVADDLTGAADTGVQFCADRVPARVVLRSTAPMADRMTVYDTDTRGRPAEEAAARLTALGDLLRAAGVRHVYKKIDSTLRGNVGAETEALLRALGRSIAIVAPAFPANRRTTRDGVQLVAGRPVHETAAATDPAHPMLARSIAEAFRAQSDLPVSLISLDALRRGDLAARALAGTPRSPELLVVDSESDADLTLVARAVARLGDRCLPVGSAGLAAQLRAEWRPPGALGPPVSDRSSRVLLVCGSLHPATRAQLEVVRQRDAAAIVEARDSAAVARAATRLSSGLAALSTGARRADLPADRIARDLADLVLATVACARPDAIVLTGGDVARAVLDAAAADAIDLEAELLPGLAVGRIRGGVLADVRVLTKSGGFGPAHALWQAVTYLRAAPAPREAGQ